MSKLTAKALKDELWKSLKGVQSGDLNSHQADSVATSAREILRTAKTQLQIVNQAKRDVPTELIDFAENKE